MPGRVKCHLDSLHVACSAQQQGLREFSGVANGLANTGNPLNTRICEQSSNIVIFLISLLV